MREDELLNGNLDCPDFKRLTREDEAVVLRTLLETSISPRVVSATTGRSPFRQSRPGLSACPEARVGEVHFVY